MRILQKKIDESIKQPVFFAVTALVVVFLLTQSKSIGEGIKEGMTLALEQVIPALYPFMILTIMIGTFLTGFQNTTKKAKAGKRAFRFSTVCLIPFVLSLVGGYPAGLKLISDLERKEQLTPAQAQILSAFCFNSGPAFLITVVGKNIFGSTKAGVALFLSGSIAAILCAAIATRKGQPSAASEIPAQPVSLSNALVSSVEKAARAVGSAAIWICLFQGLVYGLENCFGTLPDEIKIFLEVTTGCAVCAEKRSLPLASAACAFGGFCVHCQILPIIKEAKIKYRYFFKYRLLHSALSYFLTSLWVKMMPPEAVFAPTGGAQIRFDGLSIALLLLISMAFIWDTAPRKEKQTN